MIVVSDAQWPIVYVTFKGEMTDADFDAYLVRLAAPINRKERFAYILDARDATIPSLKQRQLQTQWLKVYTPRLADFCAGTCYIINSPLLRATLNAMLWVVPSPYPHGVVNTPTEAEAWTAAAMLVPSRRKSA